MDTEEKMIDFNALEKELQAAIESDMRYWRENDAKIRAVEQRVATYDEFRNLVKGAHLKPMEKKEIQKNLQDNRNNIWNTISSKNNIDSCKSSTQLFIKQEYIGLVPKTSVEFTRQWRNLHPNHRFQYLKNVGIFNMKQLFKSEIPIEVFGGLIETLSQILPADAASIAFCVRLLQTMAQIPKFDLNLKFLSSTEMLTCKKLMENLNNCFLKYQETLVGDGITEEILFDLQMKYGTRNK